MSERLEGVGITLRQLEPNTVVMVPYGQGNAIVNGGPCIIAWAVVIGPVEKDNDPTDPKARYWLNVYLARGVEPMPQMYRAEEILGVPALGLTMDGAPPPIVAFT